MHFDYVYMSEYFRLRHWELQPWICRALCCCLCVVVGEAWPGARCVYFLFNQPRRPGSATGNWGTQPLWPGYRGDIGRAGYSWQRIWATAWRTAEKLLAEGRTQVSGYKIPAVTIFIFIFIFTFAAHLCDEPRRFNVQCLQGETGILRKRVEQLCVVAINVAAVTLKMVLACAVHHLAKSLCVSVH